MDRQKIVATIDAKGRVTMETVGFVGPACATATQAFVAALGDPNATVQEKPEFYLSDAETASQEN